MGQLAFRKARVNQIKSRYQHALFHITKENQNSMTVNLTSCHVEFFLQCYISERGSIVLMLIYIVPSLSDELNILASSRGRLFLFIPAQPTPTACATL